VSKAAVLKATEAARMMKNRRPSLRCGMARSIMMHGAPRPIRGHLQFENPSAQSVTKVWPIRDMAWPDYGGFAVA
jgi:hypothetical protein